MSAFQVKILTPDGSAFDGEAVGVKIPGSLANFEVRNGHADILSTMDIGELTIKTANGNEDVYAISGGVAEMANNSLILLARTAELATEIDIERAKSAAERAKERKGDESYDQKRLELALARALNRLSTAGKYEGELA